MKKLIVMLLVLVTLASILVMPAMAAEIQPRYPVLPCPKCGRPANGILLPSGGSKFHCAYCNYDFPE